MCASITKEKFQNYSVSLGSQIDQFKTTFMPKKHICDWHSLSLTKAEYLYSASWEPHVQIFPGDACLSLWGYT